MKKVACHVLILPQDKRLSMQVVELSCEGLITDYYAMNGEGAATEWIPGICVLLPVSITPDAKDSIDSLISKLKSNPFDEGYHLWKAVGLPVDAPSDRCPEHWVKY